MATGDGSTGSGYPHSKKIVIRVSGPFKVVAAEPGTTLSSINSCI